MFSSNVIVTPNSELGKELRKWEQHHTRFSITAEGNSEPGNPYQYRPYPRMLYKAQLHESGQVRCLTAPPAAYEYLSAAEYERACLMADAFNRRCLTTVESEADERRAKADGWCESAADAVRAAEAHEQAIGRAAAEANFQVQGMSDVARREWHAAHETTDQHVVDVQGAKRGRKVVTGHGPVEN